VSLGKHLLQSSAAVRSQYAVWRLQAQHKCSAMPWVDCTAVRYQCTRQPDISLCPEAFADGLFPTGTSARDFVRLGASSEQRVRFSGACPIPRALHV